MGEAPRHECPCYCGSAACDQEIVRQRFGETTPRPVSDVDRTITELDALRSAASLLGCPLRVTGAATAQGDQRGWCDIEGEWGLVAKAVGNDTVNPKGFLVNGLYIAAAVSAIPVLVAEIRRLRGPG